jgi:hypothetical protein
MNSLPSDETTRDLINRREHELMLQALKLRDQLAPIERELADIWRAKAALGMEIHPKPRTRLATLDARTTIAGEAAFPSRLTIKGMVIKALDDHFRGIGATTQTLLDFFRDAWGHNIDRASLSAQLSRLNLDDGAVVRSGDKWILVPEAISEENLKNWGVIPPWAIVPDRFKPK